MENIIMIWDSSPTNYLTVCLESLRLYNNKCIINFYYNDEKIIKEYSNFNLNFIKIDNKESKNRFQYYKVLITKHLSNTLNENDKILVLDCDLLFQNDPFLIFNKPGDIFYTHCIMSTPDSLRPMKLWKTVKYKVNGGVWGIIVNDNSKKLLNFWIDNMLHNSWEPWKKFKQHIEHGLKNLNWWVDQDFLNCIDIHEVPFELNKVIVSYKFNYFTSTWGYFSSLEMGKKIGNNEYIIIHFKANFKDTFNINNKKIYNIKNILENKKLVTQESHKRIKKKFLSRGERRFHVT